MVTQDARERAYVSHKTRRTRLCHAAGRGACEAPLRPSAEERAPFGAPHGDFGSGAVLPSRAFPPDPCSDAPRSQVVVPGGRGPETSREHWLRADTRGTPFLSSAFR